MEAAGEITPEELKRRLDNGRAPALLDVREPWEHELCALPGARLVPLRSLPSALGTLPVERDIVVYCHHGARSRAATELLAANGYRVSNLVGGIDRWSREVDPSIPRY